MKKNHQTMANWMPGIVIALAVGWVLSGARSAPSGGAFDLDAFGRLPVVDQGRVKPLDTFARTSLMILSNKASLYVGEGGATVEREDKEGKEKAPAIRWLVDVMADPVAARNYHVIRIDHPDIKGMLGADDDRKYFSAAEIVAQGEEMNRQFRLAHDTPDGDRSLYQRKIVQLSQQMSVYFTAEDLTSMFLVPPDRPGGEWETLAGQSHAALQHGDQGADSENYTAMLAAWRDGDPGAFNAAVAAQSALVGTKVPDTMSKVRFEASYNRFAPFMKAMALYVLVGLLAVFSWLRPGRALTATALGLLLVAVALHTWGLGSRVWIQGRPPVTNLYSSAVFVGWGGVLLGGFLERLHRNGVGAAVAAGTGFLTLLVAHNLSLDGDTMTMMQAVLDTNFWLATHVVVITLGYSASFLAGALAIIFILRGVFTSALTREDRRRQSGMIYGVVCFATFASFIGTILGGIWADQSWGRFWGWDPKENGALLIVLWNALILHARWGGIARQRGIAALAVFGNIVVTWSWFGTNMLGVGLHAYGFIESALFWMGIFILSQLALIAIAMTPFEKWRSVKAHG
jgi:ABC-type transport system involved in cytochrome c biogenesis permease subunit